MGLRLEVFEVEGFFYMRKNVLKIQKVVRD